MAMIWRQGICIPWWPMPYDTKPLPAPMLTQCSPKLRFRIKSLKGTCLNYWLIRVINALRFEMFVRYVPTLTSHITCKAFRCKSFNPCWEIISHYSDVMMGTMTSEITSLTVIYSTVYSDADKKNPSKLRVTGEFPAQMASNAENFSIWWRHHDTSRHVRLWIQFAPKRQLLPVS